jgi:hypothetical protein
MASVVGSVLLIGFSGCEDEPTDPDRIVVSPADGPAHTHTTYLGDGTTSSAGGYSLTDLRFPTALDGPADLSFVLRDPQGEPVTDFVEEQTKLLHLYVVRDDYQDFRHLHPVLADDGTWTARVDLGAPGRYRVVAEFQPAAEEDGDHVVLGEETLVPGEWQPQPVAVATTATDGLVTVTAPSRLNAGADEGFTLTVSDGDRGVLNLGTYLGSYAHLTGFDVDTGAFVHAHPLGAPEVTEEGSDLQFHTVIERPGDYVLFVQVRVDGFVHTVPVSTTVR